MTLLILSYWIFSYLAGNLMAAWFVSKYRGIDLQQHHSQNLGARNAGRVLGKRAFVLTFLGDALKGSLVVILGYWMQLELWTVVTAAFFAILGHLYPFWLKFRGGKGISTFIGAGIALDPFLFLWMIIGTAVAMPIARSLTLSMVGGFIFYTAAIIATGKFIIYIPVILAIVFMLWKHRQNLQDALNLKRQK
ncbi:glycerol-3-phosphate acyltransferase [Mesobacillus zeae]|uniref:Glycerol-3-phosphate acyltransferase n=1 Tax=Mesobacillus zeae TaxID=1917180 RepID=A0A398BCF1_9BACI|nr:glycerol-3-phosphate acyltransferase [Mesobacillus zeae]RID87512.1 glycerol-3-phosphate acyltransferase [Mesobacillus zeae]